MGGDLVQRREGGCAGARRLEDPVAGAATAWKTTGQRPRCLRRRNGKAARAPGKKGPNARHGVPMFFDAARGPRRDMKSARRHGMKVRETR